MLPGPAPTAAKGAAAKFRTEIPRLAATAVQLGLIALVIDLFNIESTAFLHVCLLAFSGALVHAVLPLEYRLPFFAQLSLLAIGLVFGAVQGLLLIGLGLIFIGICHLPVSFRVRVALLLGAGAAVAALRLELIQGPWSRAIWPILGSMFMFRLVVYMYDLRHETGPRSISRTLAYFFMLPNVCFPMFPVVDYKAFKRTYYNDEAARIEQVGVQWIFRGIVQLILYRFVYYYLSMSPADVVDPVDLGRFSVANYLLYLRISGQFHVSVGVLRLFGFNLPETHRRYLFASSINDFWRRINIYWKDFMMKLFYYPSFLALRRRGLSDRWSLVVATIIVFPSTWMLHSYQWFWLRGSFPITVNDAIFWGVLGVLVVINSLYESSEGRARRLKSRRPTSVELAGIALRTVLTFCFICVLWSLWTAESVTQWLALWASVIRNGVSAQTWEALGVGALAVVIGSGLDGGSKPTAPNTSTGLLRRLLNMRHTRTRLVTTGAIAGLLIIGHPRVYTHLDSRVAGVLASVREQKLNEEDARTLERGYYENLTNVERFNTHLWELYSKRPVKPANRRTLREEGGMRFTNDFLVEELVPFLELPFKGQIVRTNRWGMRDEDYLHAKPAGMLRIALFGPSDTMGVGVSADETFASVLERRLNSDNNESHYQVLNFAASNYTPPQHLRLLELRALPFEPDVAIVIGHNGDARRAIRHLATVLTRGVDIPYQPLRQIASDVGITPGMDEREILQRLRPVKERVLDWTLRRMVEICREHRITPIWAFLPFISAKSERAEPSLLQHAREAGFAIVNMADLYEGADSRTLTIAEWDTHHPNARGHARIADRLYGALHSLGPVDER